jgi:hypothetical protein
VTGTKALSFVFPELLSPENRPIERVRANVWLKIGIDLGHRRFPRVQQDLNAAAAIRKRLE